MGKKKQTPLLSDKEVCPATLSLNPDEIGHSPCHRYHLWLYRVSSSLAPAVSDMLVEASTLRLFYLQGKVYYARVASVKKQNRKPVRGDTRFERGKAALP